MITNKATGYIFMKPEELSSMPNHVAESFKLNGISSDYLFYIPTEIIVGDKKVEIKSDHLKVIYKVGFLRKFYKLLFPDISYSKIYKIINNEWQVFKSERQMERLSKKYTETFETKEEI